MSRWGLLFLPVLFLLSQPAGLRDAIASLEHGDFPAAEKIARAEVHEHPDDALAWSVLGVSLDQQHRPSEAEPAHRRAIAGAPDSPDVLNNYANHQLAAGDPSAALATYRKVLKLDPAHFNANVQLAQLDVKAGKGAEALGYLHHLPAERQAMPAIEALVLAARSVAGDPDAAASARGNLGLAFGAGVALANAGQFEKAEQFLTLALASAPADFNVLFNLGAVAANAGHPERAREVLETALRQQPENVDVLYTLALADQALGHFESAVTLLAQASKLAPQRADVEKLLALTTAALGALEDSASAWDRYLNLQPADDAARRERAFLEVQMGQLEHGITGLRAFVTRHPDDPTGHFELGLAESKDDPAQALPHFDRALQLKPDYAAAHAARGSLYYQMGKPEVALPDLEAAAAARPNNADALDHLGQTYLALDRPADAVRTLRRAAELAPDDSKTQLHFARALAETGNTAESKAAMDRFRRLGPAANKAVPGGLVDYLSLTPDQRRADYRARVEKAVLEHPNDSSAQAAWLKLLLEDGKNEQAGAAARRLAALKAPPAVLVDSARALLESRQYSPARELLLQARTADSSVEADLAIANFQMLDAAGKSEEAATALTDALKSAPERTDLIRQAAAFQARCHNLPGTLSLTERAANAHPDDREILMVRAVTLAVAGQNDKAGQELARIQDRWPEWAAAWLARGLALHDPQAIETAKALGAHAIGVDVEWLLQHPIREW